MIAPAELERWMQALLEASGLEPAAAETVAVSLVHANRRGVDSHGVARVVVYSERLRRGRMNIAPAPRVEREHGAVALVEAEEPRIVELFIDNLRRRRDGKPLRNALDPEVLD